MPSPIPAFASADRPRGSREPPVGPCVEELLAGREGPWGKDFNMRWVAFMVAEA